MSPVLNVVRHLKQQVCQKQKQEPLVDGGCWCAVSVCLAAAGYSCCSSILNRFKQTSCYIFLKSVRWYMPVLGEHFQCWTRSVQREAWRAPGGVGCSWPASARRAGWTEPFTAERPSCCRALQTQPHTHTHTNNNTTSITSCQRHTFT